MTTLTPPRRIEDTDISPGDYERHHEHMIRWHIARREAHEKMVRDILSAAASRRRPHPSCRPVIRVDADGTETRYPSAASAARAVGLTVSAVYMCIVQRGWSSRANCWWYYADRPRPAGPVKRQMQAVEYQGRRYHSIKEMSRITGLTRRQIEYRMEQGSVRKLDEPEASSCRS